MSNRLTRLAMGVMALPLLAACATKGYVREQVTTARTEIMDTTTTMIAQERQERMAADEALRTDLQALRGALDSLRSEFDVRITQVAEGLLFGFLGLLFGSPLAVVAMCLVQTLYLQNGTGNHRPRRPVPPD